MKYYWSSSCNASTWNVNLTEKQRAIQWPALYQLSLSLWPAKNNKIFFSKWTEKVINIKHTSTNLPDSIHDCTQTNFDFNTLHDINSLFCFLGSLEKRLFFDFIAARQFCCLLSNFCSIDEFTPSLRAILMFSKHSYWYKIISMAYTYKLFWPGKILAQKGRQNYFHTR